MATTRTNIGILIVPFTKQSTDPTTEQFCIALALGSVPPDEFVHQLLGVPVTSGGQGVKNAMIRCLAVPAFLSPDVIIDETFTSFPICLLRWTLLLALV